MPLKPASAPLYFVHIGVRAECAATKTTPTHKRDRELARKVSFDAGERAFVA